MTVLSHLLHPRQQTPPHLPPINLPTLPILPLHILIQRRPRIPPQITQIHPPSTQRIPPPSRRQPIRKTKHHIRRIIRMSHPTPQPLITDLPLILRVTLESITLQFADELGDDRGYVQSEANLEQQGAEEGVGRGGSEDEGGDGFID